MIHTEAGKAVLPKEDSRYLCFLWEERALERNLTITAWW